MRDFSIDSFSERIHSPKTKDYFEEVIKSYYSESYRSAVVMLYSIAIADLLYKLEELKEIFNDSSAIEILDDISELQRRNPKSSDWERKLIELTNQKTNLLEPSDYLNLSTLQQHRHLCTHPVLTQSFELYRPNKETTRAHIRNIIEGILAKPAFLSRKVFDDLLQDLSSVKALINNVPQLEKHLNNKYFDKLNLSVTEKIFKSLWKVTFKLENQQADQNRRINLEALSILFKRNYSDLITTILSEQDFYSDIKISLLSDFIEFLNRFPEVHRQLNESFKVLSSDLINKDADLIAFSTFCSTEIDEHIEKVYDLDLGWNSPYEKTYISTSSILAIFNRSINEGKRDLAFKFIIEMFSRSDQYDTADSRFDALILPNLNNFNNEELELLVSAINDNSQIYDRRKASNSNYQIKQRINQVYTNFDFSKYPKFK